MSTYNGRWIPTPYVTISMGIGKNAIKSLIFTTLSRLNKKKYIVDVNITQTSKTTVEYIVNLKYYPNTFERASQPNDLEMKLNLALRDESTRDIYISFGYESNSPYTGTAESSPIFKGIITNMTSQVNQNYISYTIKAYGCDMLLGFFKSIDEQINNSIKEDTVCETFVREQILNKGVFKINDETTLNFDIQFKDVNLNKTFMDLLINDAMGNSLVQQAQQITESEENKELSDAYARLYAEQMGNKARYNPGLDVEQVKADDKTAAKKILTNYKEEMWNRLKANISFEALTNNYVDSSDIVNQVSADRENMVDKTQFSIYEAIEVINRLLNNNLKGTVYKLRCTVEPYSSTNSKYDGTIVIYDASKTLSSKKNFYWGLWNTKGVLTNNCTVVSWSCDYNATAKLFSGEKITTDNYEKLCNNLNTDIKVSLSADGEVNYNIVSSQTKSVNGADFTGNIAQDIQYDTMLNIVKNVLDYPYAAKITVLGIVDPWQIGLQTINVYVFVNGAEHFTSGEYLITGYSHSIGSQGFQTSYDLLKLPKDLTASSRNSVISSVLNNESLSLNALAYNDSAN